MAESTGGINQQSIDIAVTQSDSDFWSLGCDIIVEDIDMSVREIKVDDISLSGNVIIEGVSVDIDAERANVMDLDVNVVIDGISSSIVESQVVSYDKILKINDLSPESVNESIYAASARSAKKIHDFISSVDTKAGQLEFNTERISSRVEALEKAIAEGGGSGGGGGEGFSYWVLEDGKLYSNYDIHVRGNAVIEGDTSSGGSGQDTPSSGLDEEQLQDYLDLHKYVTEGYVDDAITALNLSQYAKGSDLDALQADIAKNAENIATLETNKADNNTVTALAERVSANEDAIDALDKRVTNEEAVTTTYKTWWADLKKYIKVEGSNVKIDTNLIVSGDTSSGGSGQDTPASGTVTGIKVGPMSTDILTPNNAGIIDMVSVLSSIDVSDQLKDYAKLTDIPSLDGYATETWVTNKNYLTRITKNMVDSVLGSTTAGNANRFLMSTGSTSVWASISKDMVTDALGYTPLSTAGGTIESTNTNTPLSINGGGDWVGIGYFSNSSKLGYLGIWNDYRPIFIDASWNVHTLLHSGNIGDYAVKTYGTDMPSDIVNYVGYGKIDTGWKYYGPAATFGISSYFFQLQKEYDTTNLVFRSYNNGTYTDWKTIAFTDSDITGNAATANVLKSTTGVQYTYNFNTDKIFVFGNAFEGYKAYIDGSLIALRYGSANATGLILNSSGNVTIGGSDLAGNVRKLVVDGSSEIAVLTQHPSNLAEIDRNKAFSVTYSPSNGFGLHIWLNDDGTTNMQSAYASSYYGAFNLSLQPLGGGVGIGTTDLNRSNKLRIVNNHSHVFDWSLGNLAQYSDITCEFKDPNGVDIYGLYTAINYYSGDVAMQVGRSDGLTNVYDLLLQPLGGYVGIKTYDPQYTLDVNGDISAMSALRIGGCGTSYCGLYPNSQITSGGNASRLWLYNEGGLAFYGTSLEIMTSTSINGNLVVSGDTSSGSDIRFKDVIKNKTIKIEHIAKAPLFTFKWNDREDDTIHLGSSAQYWEKVCPWLVTGEDFKSLNYAVGAMGGVISLARHDLQQDKEIKALKRKEVNHEERIKKLERKVKSLEEENRRLRYGS